LLQEFRPGSGITIFLTAKNGLFSWAKTFFKVEFSGKKRNTGYDLEFFSGL